MITKEELIEKCELLAVNCKTLSEEDAVKDLCISKDVSVPRSSGYNRHKLNYVVYPNEGLYGDIENARDDGYKIITAKEFLSYFGPKQEPKPTHTTLTYAEKQNSNKIVLDNRINILKAETSLCIDGDLFALVSFGTFTETKFRVGKELIDINGAKKLNTWLTKMLEEN